MPPSLFECYLDHLTKLFTTKVRLAIGGGPEDRVVHFISYLGGDMGLAVSEADQRGRLDALGADEVELWIEASATAALRPDDDVLAGHELIVQGTVLTLHDSGVEVHHDGTVRLDGLSNLIDLGYELLPFTGVNTAADVDRDDQSSPADAG